MRPRRYYAGEARQAWRSRPTCWRCFNEAPALLRRGRSLPTPPPRPAAASFNEAPALLRRGSLTFSGDILAMALVLQ